jgi:hypothetical protein
MRSLAILRSLTASKAAASRPPLVGNHHRAASAYFSSAVSTHCCNGRTTSLWPMQRQQQQPQQPQHHRQRTAFFSTQAVVSSKSVFRQMIKPFLIKCHPDMAKQQDLSPKAQQLNLRATQNLNSYVDGVLSMLQGKPAPSSSRVEIDFVMAFSQSHKKNAPTTSRRSVELQLPSPSMSSDQLERHVQRQLVKLLRIAGLQVPSSLSTDDVQAEAEERDFAALQQQGSTGDQDDDFWKDQVSSRQTTMRRKKTPWEKSRDNFTARMDWNKFDSLYQEAVSDMHANLATRGMIRNNPERRRALLATILQHVRVTQQVSPLEQLVALRRLLRLLDENFDRLHLEPFGNYWEQLVIVLDGQRSYNTSTSALNKRRQKKLETGFSFKIHSDNRVTIRIPVDFLEDELVEELDRNVWDFYNWMQQDTGMERIFQ